MYPSRTILGCDCGLSYFALRIGEKVAVHRQLHFGLPARVHSKRTERGVKLVRKEGKYRTVPYGRPQQSKTITPRHVKNSTKGILL